MEEWTNLRDICKLLFITRIKHALNIYGSKKRKEAAYCTITELYYL